MYIAYFKIKSELTFILIASTILAIFNPSLLHKIIQPGRTAGDLRVDRSIDQRLEGLNVLRQLDRLIKRRADVAELHKLRL